MQDNSIEWHFRKKLLEAIIAHLFNSHIGILFT